MIRRLNMPIANLTLMFAVVSIATVASDVAYLVITAPPAYDPGRLAPLSQFFLLASIRGVVTRAAWLLSLTTLIELATRIARRLGDPRAIDAYAVPRMLATWLSWLLAPVFEVDR